MFIVHGEPGPSSMLASKLRVAGIEPVELPVRGQHFTF